MKRKKEFLDLKKKLFNQYWNNYMNYWIKQMKKIKLPHLNSVERVIEEIDFLTNESSPFYQTLKKFHQAIQPLRSSHKGIPDSVIELSDWLNHSHGKKVFETSLLTIRAKLETIKAAQNYLDSVKETISTHSSDNLLVLINTLKKSTPTVLKSMINNFSKQLIQCIIDQAVINIKYHWHEVLQFYQQNIESYYPINPIGIDIPIQTFIKFFGHDGMLLTFFNAEVKPFLNSSNVALSYYFSEKINNITPILNKLFWLSERYGWLGENKEILFYIKPERMSKQIKEVQLSIDKINISYAHGPLRQFLYQWPNNAHNKELLVSCHNFSSHVSHLHIKGRWAIFRLFEKNNVHLNKNIFGRTFIIFIKQCSLLLTIKVTNHPDE
jgi:type VI protein secretion system component VasK